MMRVKQGQTLHTTQTIDTIDYTVTDTSDGSQVASGSLQVADVMFDELQTTDWDDDVIGYNFRVNLSPSHFATAGKLFNVHFTFTPTAGYPMTVDVEVETNEDDE